MHNEGSWYEGRQLLDKMCQDDKIEGLQICPSSIEIKSVMNRSLIHERWVKWSVPNS